MLRYEAAAPHILPSAATLRQCAHAGLLNAATDNQGCAGVGRRGGTIHRMTGAPGAEQRLRAALLGSGSAAEALWHLRMACVHFTPVGTRRNAT
ncbi:hypothetical protein SAMN00790413_06406 [Deinococcus hopiensis KR-140]|uniref:Uncharacterized protein n=1 Tax=Deinococcus hopiensis KR-140 TaxID=695939 RepID=A0A1W1VUZ6_9DEIO|nr:hypothetical protein SAMN00790413_06406 [Deinococcus hopiensis KR-140]